MWPWKKRKKNPETSSQVNVWQDRHYHWRSLWPVEDLNNLTFSQGLIHCILYESLPNHVIGFSDLTDLWVIKIKKPMILCTRCTSRSRDQSTKRRSRSENIWKVCLFFSQNNKIVWLSNVVDTFLEKLKRCAKVCGLFSLDCTFWMLIGWAGKLRSRGHGFGSRSVYGAFFASVLVAS